MPKSVDGDIRLTIGFDQNGINRGIKNTESAINGLQSSLKKFGGAIAAAFSIKAIVNFGSQAVELASDISEVQNVVDTAFGNMAYKCEAFADTAIEQFGMSKLAAKQTASTYMSMAKSMGVPLDAASDMAIEVAKLTGDVASFYNLDHDSAATKLKSIFTGETETLKDLGVVMTETNLKEFAMAKGITKSYNAMTQAEKVGLRYAFVTNALSDASGDFAKTQNSWANQTRILSERWKEFMSEIGSALITVLTPALQILNNIVSALTSFAVKIKEITAALFGTNMQESEQTDHIQSAVTAQNYLTDAIEETAQAQNKSLAGFDEINKISGNAPVSKTSVNIGTEAETISSLPQIADSSTIKAAEHIKMVFQELIDWFNANLAPSFASAMDNITPKFSGIKDTFQNIFADSGTLAEPIYNFFNGSVTPFLQTTIENWGDIIAGLSDTLSTTLSSAWKTVFLPASQMLLTTIWPFWLSLFTNISNSATQTFGIIKSIFDKVWSEGVITGLSSIVDIWSDIWSGISNAWKKWGAPIFEGLNEAIENIGQIIENKWNGQIKPIWDKLLSALTDIWDNHLKPLWDNILDFVGEIVNCALTIYNNAIAPAIMWLQDKLYPIVVKVWQGIIDFIKPIIAGIIDTVNGIITTLKGIVHFITAIFKGDWEEAWNGIKMAFKGIWDTMENIVKTPINAIIGLVNKLLAAIIGGLNHMIDAINTLSFDIPEWVPLIGGETFGFNFDHFETPQIPMLATGAVIPANREFLAVLGDQKHGTNVEAPLATIEQAVANVISRTGTSGQTEAILEIDGEKFGRLVYKLNKRESKRVGINFSEV